MSHLPARSGTFGPPHAVCVRLGVPPAAAKCDTLLCPARVVKVNRLCPGLCYDVAMRLILVALLGLAGCGDEPDPAWCTARAPLQVDCPGPHCVGAVVVDYKRLEPRGYRIYALEGSPIDTTEAERRAVAHVQEVFKAPPPDAVESTSTTRRAATATSPSCTLPPASYSSRAWRNGPTPTPAAMTSPSPKGFGAARRWAASAVVTSREKRSLSPPALPQAPRLPRRPPRPGRWPGC